MLTASHSTAAVLQMMVAVVTLRPRVDAFWVEPHQCLVDIVHETIGDLMHSAPGSFGNNTIGAKRLCT